MGRKYTGSSLGGRKSLIRLIADRMNQKAAELERQTRERLKEQQYRKQTEKADHLTHCNDYLIGQENDYSIEPKDVPLYQKKFIFEILKNGDKIIVGTIPDLLHDYMQIPCRGIVLFQDTAVKGFDIMNTDKMGLVYSKKMKSILWLGFNSSECYIVFATQYDTLEDLSNMNIIGLDSVYNRLKSNENYSIENILDRMSNYIGVIDKVGNNELVPTNNLF